MSNTPENAKNLTAEQRALLALRRMRTRLEALEREKSEPIAIIGMGCRFPGKASTPEDFWQLLKDGKDAITQLTTPRWDIDAYFERDPHLAGRIPTQWSGFLEDVDQFDAAFFGVSPREAAYMDPQQRFLLEVAWEALENAGQPIQQLAGSLTGVFVGICNLDYNPIASFDPHTIDPYYSTGSAYSVASGRLSYMFDFQGPSVSVDTACSSSLVAVHLASQSLRNRECNLALAAGTNLILSPLPTMALAKWGMLSPEGRCKTFDAGADGFVRGEGCGVVVLKRLSDAIADNDTILALLQGSAVNQDGHSNGITAPNALAQQAVIRQALTNAGITPEEIAYIEAHGTGTPLGDPIEIDALTSTLSAPRANGQNCIIGSVKTNIGHLEAAAGIASLIKVVLSLQHEELPPHRNLHVLNPNISFDGTPFVISTSVSPWKRGDRPRYASINSFGFSGTNAHVILKEAPAPASESEAVQDTATAYLLPISARSPEALRTLARTYQEFLTTTTQPLSSICYTASLRRSHQPYRVAFSGETPRALHDGLQVFLDNDNDNNDDAQQKQAHKAVQPRQPRKVAFVFAGQSSQWVGMGQELYQREKAFRDVIDQCDELMQPYTGWSLKEELRTDQEHTRLNATEVAQPALFALEIGLAALWNSWGITPDMVVGHSVGEVAAAYVAGVLNLPEAVRLVCLRGSVMQPTSGQGKMLATGLSRSQATQLLTDWQDRVTIATENSPSSVVLAGDPEAIDEIARQLASEGIFNRVLEMPYAFHSPQMDSCQRRFVEQMQTLHPQSARIPLISTVTGQVMRGEDLDVAYWSRNVREPVLFAQAVAQLIHDQCAIFLEIGPHPVLATAITQSLAEAKRAALVLPSLRRLKPEQQGLLDTLGTFYAHGLEIHWQQLYPHRERSAVLPNNPWQHERFWVDEHSAYKIYAASAGTTSIQADAEHPLLGARHRSALHHEELCWEALLDVRRLSYLRDHRVRDLLLLPGSAYIEMALAAGRHYFGGTRYTLENLQFQRALTLQEQQPVLLQTFLRAGEGDEAMLQCFSQEPTSDSDANPQWTLHVTGTLRRALERSQSASDPTLDIEEIRSRCQKQVSHQDHYRTLQERGLSYGAAFRGVKMVWSGSNEVIAQLYQTTAVVLESQANQLHPALLDAALQSFVHLFPPQQPAITYVPVGLERMQVSMDSIEADAEVWAYATVAPDAFATHDRVYGNLSLHLSDGRTIAEIQGLQLLPLTVGTGSGSQKSWLYGLSWESMACDDAPVLGAMDARGYWLIFADTRGIAAQLQQQLHLLAEESILVERGTAYQRFADDRYSIDATRITDFERLIQEALVPRAEPCRGIIHLWNLDAGLCDTQEALRQTIDTGSTSILYLVQSLMRAELPASPPRLWLVTSGVQDIALPAAEPVHIEQAPAWGLGQVINGEYPELRCSCVDLSNVPEEEVDALLTEIHLDAHVEQLALRRDVRYAARLKPYQRQADTELRFEANGTYLITGGLGGLGLAIAQWLLQHGCRHLVLIGRKGSTAETTPTLAAMRASGAHVLTASADVSNAEEMAAILEMIAAEMPPLRGIMHAAGIIDDTTLMGLDRERFWRVLIPKVIGGWHLHRLTINLPLDFFVCFSSAASLLGSPGQGNYVAANMFLDVLAHARQHAGLPALSINWGPWSQIGMAERSNLNVQLASRGLNSITPEQGLMILGQLLQDPVTQVGVLPFDARQWHSFRQDSSSGVLFADLDDGQLQQEPQQNMQPLGEILTLTASEERPKVAEDFVIAQIAQVLRLPRTYLGGSTELNSLGFDSLMSLELRSRLENNLHITLPVMFVMEHPTITSLVSYLIQQFAAREQGQHTNGHTTPIEKVRLLSASPER